MKPTLQTVADAVGVSRSTISNAYSRPDQLSPQLREKILKTAQRLGYAGPDPTARSLRRGRAGAIGVLLAPAVSYAFSDPFAVEFMRGLAETAEREYTGILLVPLKEDDEDALAAVQSAAVDGFCVYCVPGWYRSLDAAVARGLPVVNSSAPSSDDPMSLFVGIDENAATVAAGRYLTGLGHRRVAVIGNNFTAERSPGLVSVTSVDDVPSYTSRERLRGYREAFTDSGVAWDDVATVEAIGNSRDDGRVAAGLALDDAAPTALIALSDVLALGALDAVRERGLRPGTDVSVVGFDDIPAAAAAGLTTVHQSAFERGRVAARLLLDLPDDPDSRSVFLPAELIVRATTGPAKEASYR
jgi:DNA-binding LacI/PurR family transcriptional regulator